MNTISSLLYFIAQTISGIATNQTAKKVLASPNNATGKPSFRSLVASDITSGQLATDRIPSLDASKIGSGVFPAARIPNLDASKITTGVLVSARGGMSSAEKTKLNGIATGAEVNQNAFSNVKVGSTTMAADAKTDTLTLEAGSNITLTPDATNDKVTIAASAKNVKVKAFTTSAISLSAGGYYNNGVISAAESGWTLIGVVGWQINNASDGSGWTYCYLQKLAVSSNSIIFALGNRSASNTAKVVLTVVGLYIK